MSRFTEKMSIMPKLVQDNSSMVEQLESTIPNPVKDTSVEDKGKLLEFQLGDGSGSSSKPVEGGSFANYHFPPPLNDPN